jgi:hypothetical protein
MQLILVKIKWDIKWKYLIQKFHDICLSYYFNYETNTYFTNDMRVTQDLKSFGEIIAHAHSSVDEKMSDASNNIFRVYHISIIAQI